MSSHPHPVAQPSIAMSTSPSLPRSIFLAFKVGGEEYGIPVDSVQEIHAYSEPTPIADAPPHVCGVLDLRGAIAPIVDLRRVFKTQRGRHEPPPVVIALRLGDELIGVVVDGVTGVLELGPEQLLPVPRPHEAVDSELVLAIGSVEERLLVLIDLARILGNADLGLSPGTLH